MQTLDNYINQVKTLPPAPKILPRLLELLNDPEASAQGVVELILVDPALTAKVLQRCNSTAFGLPEPVYDLQTATGCLGFDEIYRIVTTVVLEGTLGMAQPGYGIAEGQLWEHSVVSAIATRILAKQLGANENLAFTAGLLHDIGKLILSGSLNGAYSVILAQTTGPDGTSFLEAEKNILGVEHAEIGGRVLSRWNFPPNLASAVWYHHDPSQARPHEKLAATVNVGDMIAHIAGYSHGFQAYAVRSRSEVMQILGISSTDIEQLAIQTVLAVEQATWFTPSKKV